MAEDEKPFDERPEWADVTPIAQDDGPHPIVPIVYSPAYATAMGYFRAISRINERSKRALDVTEFIINWNPAHYTVWIYRQKTLLALGVDLSEELELIEVLAEEHPKSYQIWHHRQWIVERTNDASQEIGFINRMLQNDSKNYHAWSYRQWVVSRFGLWDDEIPDIDLLISEDVRNNSAWNQRYFVYSQRPAGFSEADLEAELTYTISKIRLAPGNESPWNYLKGIIKLAGRKIEDCTSVLDLCLEYMNRKSHVPQAFAILLHIYESRVKSGDGEHMMKAVEEAIVGYTANFNCVADPTALS
ncbi:hypothetical protein HK102_002339 [Quaeritorhiza haematococci]|nr:hypothetical protein HK102_002339 [Quaeritorhiza haematococci]